MTMTHTNANTNDDNQIRQDLIERLTQSRAVIASGWTQGAFALNKHGNIVSSAAKSACKFCAIGGLRRTTRLRGWGRRDAVLYLYSLGVLRKCLPKPYTSVESFNDNPNTTQADVLSLYTRAIEYAKTCNPAIEDLETGQ